MIYLAAVQPIEFCWIPCRHSTTVLVTQPAADLCFWCFLMTGGPIDRCFSRFWCPAEAAQPKQSKRSAKQDLRFSDSPIEFQSKVIFFRIYPAPNNFTQRQTVYPTSNCLPNVKLFTQRQTVYPASVQQVLISTLQVLPSTCKVGKVLI